MQQQAVAVCLWARLAVAACLEIGMHALYSTFELHYCPLLDELMHLRRRVLR